MTHHHRKNGQRQSQPICLWNGILEIKHRDRMGKHTALWLYLEMLDKITLEDSQGVGWLLGKKPIKLQEFGGTLRTNHRFFRTLLRFGYIVVRRTPYGYVIGVTNSRKLRFGRLANVGQSGVANSGKSQAQSGQSRPGRLATSGHYKEDNAVDNAVSSVRFASFWQALEVDPKRLPPALRRVCEDRYRTKGDQSPVDFLSACMDAIQGKGWRIPPQLAQAKSKLRASGPARNPMPELKDPLAELETSRCKTS
jgi:hypothetical protein